ncbi:MAG TPA: mechanosensitive ion channel domain-containing protein [Bryobacteraceae bacterium]|jgi:small-conductance mechanosensitive channel|nr:mechanosensitive ion channel domain-containing protein [Bryobacteraceae bacterium]
MKRLNPVPPIILALLLLGCLAAYYATRESATPRPPRKIAASEQTPVVDGKLLATAQRSAALAETSDEQDQARIALHLADQELDEAFATALREAQQYHPPASGPLRDLTTQIDQLKSAVAADQGRVAQLTKQGAADQLELAQAQLSLDQDELEDAQQDLARQGGDPHATIERALQDHEASQHQAERAFQVVSASPTVTLSEQVRSWLSLGSRFDELAAAEQQALNQAQALSDQHKDIEQQLGAGRPAPGGSESQDTTARISSLRRLSDQRKTLTEFDKRIQDSRQLASSYRTWAGLVYNRRREVLHLLLSSLAQILAILLGMLLVNRLLARAFHLSDKKRLQQMRIMTRIGVQVIALALILLIIFGRPNQISTIIGLTTAGLTLALKDFLVSFFGWFALMGKNGISVGDWVEIEGVGGEVIEIGLLKTVLLELGNWTNTGHPTGRQVAFANSFAIERHYFNFSTTGQWLWDELHVTLPAAGDPYQIVQEIRQLVEHETQGEANQAEQDWERVTKQYGARSFSAKPAVDLRPSVNGLEVEVRYITRAPERNAVKSKLFEGIVGLLHKPAAEATT